MKNHDKLAKIAFTMSVVSSLAFILGLAILNAVLMLLFSVMFILGVFFGIVSLRRKLTGKIKTLAVMAVAVPAVLVTGGILLAGFSMAVMSGM